VFTVRRDVTAVSDVEKERAALENVPPNLYESVCVPDLSEFLGGYHPLTGGDQKVANTGTSSGGGHPPTAVTPTPASNASAYLHDGEYAYLLCLQHSETVLPNSSTGSH
jgi:hypothetical protein